MYLLESLRGRLLLAGLVLVLFGSALPWWSTRQAGPVGGAAQREEQVFTLGLPNSPWLRSVKSRQDNADGTVTYTTGSNYYPLSVSVLVAIAGLGLIVVGLAQRDKPKDAPATAAKSK